MAETVPCKSCGRPVAGGDQFCPACGTAVSQVDATAVEPALDPDAKPTQCVKCGNPMGREDGFCTQCGASRPEPATVVSNVSLRNTQATHLIEATTDEFEIVEQLGTGAMGAVYLAKDVALGRQVAIKVIAPNLLSDDSMISRFRLEAQTVASLRHPNIVKLHAVRQSDDLHYFVMEYIDGPPLRSIVKSHAPLDVDIVRAMIFQVGSALSYAHRSGGVIHRDVKPANIMVDREGDAFVTDFGISKISEGQSGLTQTGATIGTPEYMSPEQCRGETLTGASDQYALGVVAYEMLCGRTPFSGTQYFVMVAHTSEAPTPIQELRPDCPPQLAAAVERMLAKTPQERWPDLDAAVSAMGGRPLGYQDPIRWKIKGLIDATGEGDGSGPSSKPSSGQSVADTATSVTVTNLPSVLETGERLRLQADVRGSGEASLSGVPVVWASTDPSIARVDGDFVEGIRPGSVSITASAGNVASSVLIKVTEPAPAEVAVMPSTVTMHEGGRISLGARVMDKRGAQMDKGIRWTTSDRSVVTVTQEGQVVATGAGTATVDAESEGVVGSARITVEASPVVAAPAKTAPVPSGSAGRRRPAGIAVLLLALVGLGYVGLRMVGGGGGEAPPATVPGGVVGPGGTDGLVADGAPADPGPGANAADASDAPPEPSGAAPGASGATSEPDAVASSASDPAPEPNGGAAGAAADPPGGAAPGGNEPPAGNGRGAPPPDRPAATTSPPPAARPVPSRIAVALRATSMQSGASQTASAQVFASSGAGLPPGSYTLSWRSSNPRIVSVDGRTGVVRAAGAGTAWLVASAGAASDSIRVTVVAAVAAVDIAGSDFDMETGASPRTLRVSVTDGSGQPMQRQVAWTSSNDGVARVNASGVVTAVGAGTARITASAEGFSDQVTVSVSAPVSAPAPAPAPVSAPRPAAPSDAQVRAAIDGYVAALAQGDRDAITRYWGSGPSDQLDDLLELTEENSFSASVTSVGEATLSGGGALVGFGVSASYRTSFGQNRQRDLAFSARLVPSGSEWRVESCVLR